MSNIQVGLLTKSQKNEIQGKLFAFDSYFNVIQDASDNWIISIEEIEQCVNEEFIWVKDLPLIDYVPKEIIL
jgi:small nuclear ribonucleoprotein (snRNP)-like protein